jgi:ParB family chromosome partitioning protein
MTKEILIADINPSRWQPRKSFNEDELWELAQSIKQLGLITPITVLYDGVYELVAGERRSRAMAGLALGDAFKNHTAEDYVRRMAHVGLTGLNDQERQALAQSGATITAQVEVPESDNDYRRLHRAAVVENIERADLTPIEEAHGLHSLAQDYGWSQRRLAEEIGKSQGYVAQRLALLDLPEKAQEAVNTRVLTLSHARTLQSVPDHVVNDVTEQVIRNVEDGATTREVEQSVKLINAFLDPARYAPQNGTTYLPKERNRLRLIRWLVSEQRPDLDALRDNRDVLLAKTTTLIQYRFRCDEVAKVFGYENSTKAFNDFAKETARQCGDCRWHTTPRDPSRYDWPFTNIRNRPCYQWCGHGRPNGYTCVGFIDENDPLIIYLGDFKLQSYLVSLGISYKDDPKHLVCDSVEDFLAIYERARSLAEEKATERERKKDQGYLDDIAKFQAWQDERSDQEIAHFQAHACLDCAHCIAEKPSCEYARDPMKMRHRDGYRAPDFVVLVTQDGKMLPRCERFRRKQRPPVPGTPGTSFTLKDRETMLTLMRQLINTTRLRSDYGIWLPLQWLPYERPRPESSDDWSAANAVVDYVETLWMMPSNRMAEKIVGLLEALITDLDPCIDSRRNIIELSNPVRGQREQFVAVNWNYVTGERDWPDWKEWPEGWPDKPWE